MELIKKIVVISIFYLVIVLFLNKILALDSSLFIAVNAFSNPFLDTLFFLVTYVGSSVFWIAMVILFWMENKKKVSVYLLMVFVIDSVTSFLLKIAFFRPRPYDVLPISILGLDTDLGPSFPSGHSQRAFSGAMIIGSFYKKYRIPLFLLAILVAVSRVYLGLHYPLDTLVGAVNGIITGMIALHLPYKPILKRLEKI